MKELCQELRARFKRWFHCLVNLHRPVDLVSPKFQWQVQCWLVEQIGCECGKVFWQIDELKEQNGTENS